MKQIEHSKTQKRYPELITYYSNRSATELLRIYRHSLDCLCHFLIAFQLTKQTFILFSFALNCKHVKLVELVELWITV